MNIFIYQPRCSYYVGGAEIFALENAKFLSKIGNRVNLVVIKSNCIKESDIFKKFKDVCRDVLIHYIELGDEYKFIYDDVPGMNQFRWDNESYYVGLLARDFLSSFKKKIDLIVAHYATDIIAFPFGIDNVLHLHGYPFELNYLNKIMLSHYNKYIAVSEKIRDEWSAMLNINKDDIPVFYNGVDECNFYPKNLDKKYTLLYIGRIIEIKGIQHIVEAVKIIRDKGENITFAIAGTGPFEKDLKQLVSQYKLDEYIHFLGFVEENLKVDLYNSVKFCVLPSIGKEGVLTTMLESSSCGVPVITTSNSSMEEFITDRFNGLLVESKNIENLVDAILDLNNNSDFLDVLSTNARRQVIEYWTWQKQIELLNNAYHSFKKKDISYNKIESIILDIDGTITDEEGNIPRSVSDNIILLIEKGFRVVFCTARDVESTLDIFKNSIPIERLSKCIFISSAGASVFNIDINLNVSYVKQFFVNLNEMKEHPVLKKFLNTNSGDIEHKKSAILIKFLNKEVAIEKVIELNNLLINDKYFGYVYNNYIVISENILNKMESVKILERLKIIDLNKSIIVGDNGGKFEADYHFLAHKNAYTVGTNDLSSRTGPSFVFDNNQIILHGYRASNYIFRKLLNLD